MRAVVIVVVAPCRNQLAGMAQPGEEVLVQAFVAEPAVEALHEAVLHGLARRDVVPLDMALLLPLQDGVRGQLGAVVADHHAGIAADLGDPVQLASHPDAGDGGVDDRGQAFPAEDEPCRAIGPSDNGE